MSEAPPSPSNRGGNGCTIAAIIVLGFVVFVIAVILAGGNSLLQTILQAPAKIIQLPAPIPTTVVLPTVINQIKPLGQLRTASYFLSTVVDTSMSVGALSQRQRVLLVACGRVDAGVDLSKLQQQDVLTSGDKVTIRLPQAEIFTQQLFDDRNCTYVVLREEGILLPPNLQLETAAREAAVANFRETALQNGILDEAQTNAQGELRRLLTLLGYRDIQFAPPNAPSVPPNND